MTLRFEFTELARLDLDLIWDHIAQDNPNAATRLVDLFYQAVRRAGSFPNVGRPREELGKDMRSLAVGNYLIFYLPLKDRIEVLRIVHGSRDLPDLF